MLHTATTTSTSPYFWSVGRRPLGPPMPGSGSATEPVNKAWKRLLLVRNVCCCSYEADRVIIRQGHRAQNFYLIMSGKGEQLLSVMLLLVTYETRLTAICHRGTVFGRDQRSCSTPGPVTTWMGDRLQTGKPSRCVTSHLR